MKTARSRLYAVNAPIMYKGVVIALLLVQFAFADIGAAMRRGNSLMRKGEYQEALEKYQEALIQEPDDPEIHYNIARALYKMEKYDEAIGEFQMGLLSKNKKFQADVFYNIGNCQFRKGALDAAIESYRTTLLLNHKDMEAKQNLEFCLKIKDQMQNQPQQDSTGQDQQQQQQEQQQPRPQEISKQEAERILQALEKEEKENLEKTKKPEKEEHVEKDW
jgi:Ca-activated chloride channel family protein